MQLAFSLVRTGTNTITLTIHSKEIPLPVSLFADTAKLKSAMKVLYQELRRLRVEWDEMSALFLAVEMTGYLVKQRAHQGDARKPSCVITTPTNPFE